MVRTQNLHLDHDAYGVTPFGVTTVPLPIRMAQQVPLDQHHQEPPKQLPLPLQEIQADDQVQESRHHGVGSEGSSNFLFEKHIFSCFMKTVKLRPTSHFFGEAEVLKLGCLACHL
jgi:hypothetical protein